MKSLGLLLTMFASVVACAQSNNSNPRFRGEDVTAEFVKTHLGTYTESEWDESFTISPNGAVARVMERQVGREESKTVPYETVCRYVYLGNIKVEKRLAEDRQRYIDFATHMIYFDVMKVMLLPTLKNGGTPGANCKNFENEENAEIKQRGTLNYSYPTELLDSNSFRIQTAGGGDYKEGGVRTESTLDEVYVKQGQ